MAEELFPGAGKRGRQPDLNERKKPQRRGFGRARRERGRQDVATWDDPPERATRDRSEEERR